MTPLLHVAPPRFLVRALHPGETVLASLRGAALPKAPAGAKAAPVRLLATSTRLLYGSATLLSRPTVAEVAYPHIQACDPWRGAPSPHLALHTAEVTLTVPLRGADDAAFITRLVTGATAGIVFLPPAAATHVPPALAPAPPIPALPSVAPTVRLSPDDLDAPDIADLAEVTHHLLAALGFQVRQTQGGADGIEMQALDPHPLRGGAIIVRCQAARGPVGRAPVQDLDGAVRRVGALKGVLVIAGRFAPDARAYALDKPLTLLERAELDALAAAHGVGARGSGGPHLAATVRLRPS